MGAGDAVEGAGGPQVIHLPDEVCSFYFINADYLRSLDGRDPLPNFQEIRANHPEHVDTKEFSFARVASGTHSEDIVTVSHRWFTQQRPDPDAVQLQACPADRHKRPCPNIELC